MRTYIVATLLALSLVGRLSAAVAEDTIIRLPTHGLGADGAGRVTAGLPPGMGRPSCCDHERCGGSILRSCRCLDDFEHCPATCEDCERVVTPSGRYGYYCHDSYFGGPAPRCTKVGRNGHISSSN
ncbi:uncharacterized protein LOC125547556 [Triticum urartu]|uniref:uncharacterized protein LOC125547553 n=1 Tax=Triticum urartu TaxID=4572 RepID=UPI002044589E|nr:uncharacterized protein LOC125547553 [Triticum urartu]XP_048567338.1 uncharacterized protein LOC125547556 [Triticum urartu]